MIARTLAALAIVLSASMARAQRTEHTVRAGQSLARIAQRYQVSVSSLAAANGLARNASVRPGQVLHVPEEGTHYVAAGETLAEIARSHGTTVAELARLNRIPESRPLRVGERLVLPGFEVARVREEAARRWGRPRSPGVATVYRRSLDRRFRIRLVDRHGRARRQAVARLRELMRPRRAQGGRLGPAPPARLVEILARVSDHFGGRTITLVSGYRPAGGFTQESSRHVRGHAIDIRIQGVPLREVRDYVRRTFDRVGVGFYPRSHFVHVDVRDRNTYWVDRSGPGEEPRYDSGEGGEGAAAAEEDDGGRADPDRARLEDEAG